MNEWNLNSKSIKKTSKEKLLHTNLEKNREKKSFSPNFRHFFIVAEKRFNYNEVQKY